MEACENCKMNRLCNELDALGYTRGCNTLHPIRKTNADKIRRMSDEELSYFIARQRFYLVNKIADELGIDVTPSFLNVRKNVFDWLTQEVESDA